MHFQIEIKLTKTGSSYEYFQVDEEIEDMNYEASETANIVLEKMTEHNKKVFWPYKPIKIPKTIVAKEYDMNTHKTKRGDVKIKMTLQTVTIKTNIYSLTEYQYVVKTE